MEYVFSTIVPILALLGPCAGLHVSLHSVRCAKVWGPVTMDLFPIVVSCFNQSHEK